MIDPETAQISKLAGEVRGQGSAAIIMGLADVIPDLKEREEAANTVAAEWEKNYHFRASA